MEQTAEHLRLKKRYGQHFLRDKSVVDAMLATVQVDVTSSVMEIGCGDGFLTRRILQLAPARLWCFEIDTDWAQYVRQVYGSQRLRVVQEDFLTTDLDRAKVYAPWIVLANLPYNITFPILYRLQQYRDMLQECVLMMQEEVAQKIIQTSGRGYGFPSLFLQHYFTWKMLRKVPPDSFYPKPKVTSRLVHLVPVAQPEYIPYEDAFWQFVQTCFTRPRKTLRNNLKETYYPLGVFSQNVLRLRAQEVSKEQFLAMWQQLYPHLS